VRRRRLSSEQREHRIERTLKFGAVFAVEHPRHTVRHFMRRGLFPGARAG